MALKRHRALPTARLYLYQPDNLPLRSLFTD